MKNINLTTTVRKLAYEELATAQKKVVDMARAACQNSYSPYSHFAVGAALELGDGTTLSANNQENAAYPSGLCAERSLLFYAKANYPQQAIVRMAISAKTAKAFSAKPVSPCGACRQVILETARRQDIPIELILAGADETYVIDDATTLLPLQFDADDML